MSLYQWQQVPNGDHRTAGTQATLDNSASAWDNVNLASPAQTNYNGQQWNSQQPLDPYSAAAYGNFMNSRQQQSNYGHGYANSYAENQWGHAHANASHQSTQAQPKVQHTPILSNRMKASSQSQEQTAPVEAAVEGPEVPQQVTPESSYSVETFDSSRAPGHGEEWDDWEKPNTEDATVVEGSNEEISSQTRSEPAGLGSYDHSREPSQTPSYNGWDQDPSYQHEERRHASEHERNENVPAVAQVAPLVKKHSVEPFEQPVARVGPVHQAPTTAVSTESSNVQRVAPTRPHNVSETNHEEGNFASEPPLAENSVDIAEGSASAPNVETHQPSTQRPSSSPRSAEPSNSLVVTQSHSSSSRRDSTPEFDNRASTAISSFVDSPGEAQATSTPITDTVPSASLERRASTSSVRSNLGMQPPPPMQPTLPGIPGDQSDNSTQGSLSFVRNGGVRSSYHERYRGVKEKYLDTRSEVPQVMHRLDKHRTETPRLRKLNPLLENAAVGRRPPAMPTASIRPKHGYDTSFNVGYREDEANTTNYSQPDPSLDQSIDLNRTGTGYGEEFVDASRRSRLNRSRPSSRAKSEIGESFRTMPPPRGYEFDYRQTGYYPQYPQGPMNRSGRMSVTNDYMSRRAVPYEDRRPQSMHDARAVERFMRAGGNLSTYDAYAQENDDESLSDESEIEEEDQGESEDEMRQYMHLPPTRASNSYVSNRGYYPQNPRHIAALPPTTFTKEEMYLFGAIRLDTHVVEHILRTMPPPREYFTLLRHANERVAYLYYASVYNEHYADVSKFRDVFNQQFYKFKCEGDNTYTALYNVCKGMYDNYMKKKISAINIQQKAYEASQRQLFSDDRDSADGVSDAERASVDYKDDEASDALSVDISQRAPMKYRQPHAFVTFGPGGKIVTMNPEVSVSTIQIDDVKSVLHDHHSRRLIDSAQIFKGPLTEGRTPTHTVRLYIQRQIDRIRSSEVAQENPHANDVIDTLLVWQLLEMVVQQQGRVTGPDIARLLVAATPVQSRSQSHIHSNHREKSATPTSDISSSTMNVSAAPVDPRAYERFTQFLLGGHIDEALECAVCDGLYADAMTLARRIFAGDERRLMDIEARFLTTRPPTNPVMTLVAVASGQAAPVLTNPPVDDAGSWRTHAAIVLANLTSGHAMDTVYRLGRVLAKREYNAAADFCLLAVSLLSNFDVFQAPVNSDEDPRVRQHIALIHASLPDDDVESTWCRYGFSLADLHATEIFDYAMRLAQRPSLLQNSVEYQRRRMQYATLLASYGGFSTDAYRYAMSVASSIWNYYYMMTSAELSALADLADRLKLMAGEEASDSQWIETLRGMIAQMPQSSGMLQSHQTVQQVQSQEQREVNPLQGGRIVHKEHKAEDQQLSNAHVDQTQPSEKDLLTFDSTPSLEQLATHSSVSTTSRSKSEALESEARNWHADRQEPLQMSPKGQGYTSSTMNTTLQSNDYCSGPSSPGFEDYQTPPPPMSPHRERSESLGQVHESVDEAANHDFNSYAVQQQPPVDYSSHVTSNSVDIYQNVRDIPQSPVDHSHDMHVNNVQVAASQMPTIPVDPNPPTPKQMPPLASLSSEPTPSHDSRPPIPANPVGSSKQQQRSQEESSVAPKSVHDRNLGNSKKNNGSAGFLASVLRKVVPQPNLPNPMILPDDKNKTITFDKNLGKWVGQGVEQETVAAPPPTMPVAAPAPSGLRSARASGGSRYFNPMAPSNGEGSVPAAPVPVPSMPIPTSFVGFIPAMPDDAESVDPFSGQAQPSIPCADDNAESSS